MLQDALDKSQDRSHTWQLNIFHKKCTVLEFGSTNNSSRDYTLHDINISKANACNNLGVTIDHIRFRSRDTLTSLFLAVTPGPVSSINASLSRDRATLVRAFITFMCVKYWNMLVVSSGEATRGFGAGV